ncbi:MAG: YeeE/YedE family protein [Anaerolineales bacterium]|nr:YeeE/YedE family protein [Anaerolineales bacterium]
MFDFLTSVRWSPYVVGAGIGVLSWFTLLISGSQLGCSTAFARAAGSLERLIGMKKAAYRPYYQKIGMAFDWKVTLVIGILGGSFLSAWISGDFSPDLIPAIWAARFGGSVWLRVAAALLGGVLLGFGSRWADGCTSGHGISGTMQLALSSWISAIFFFVGGILMAFVLFGFGG